MVTSTLTRSLALALLLLAPFALVGAESSAQAYTGDATNTADPGDGFTMVIATHKRDALLPPLIEHLTTTPPPSLRQIVFIWQNVGTPLPDFLNATALEHYSESGVDVKVRMSRKNSMNERFRPLAGWHQHIKTRAVMIMDDDVALRRETLEWGYQQWKEFNDGGHGGPTKGKIVGFAGRDAEFVGGGKWGYTVQPRTTYSMVLSNAAWFKRDWLEKYWEDSQEMKGLRDYVDKVFNCDDLLINYIVSNLTHTSPLLLQPKTPLRTVPTKGLWNRDDEAEDSFMGAEASKPSSSASPTSEDSTETDDAEEDPMKADHFATRELCLARYFAHFAQYSPTPRSPGHYPLVRSSTSVSQDVVDRARWLSPGEQWEEPVWQLSDDSGAEDRERLEREEFEAMVENMSDDEVREFMEQLEAFEAGEGHEDEDDEEEHHYEEEGRPWRKVDELR